MSHWYSRIFVLCLLGLMGLSSWAESSSTKAKTIVIGMGNFEPYFIAEEQGGIFTEIVDLVLQAIPGYQFQYRFDHSNSRLIQQFKQGKLDAVANLFDSFDIAPCRTPYLFHFHDMAITRKQDQLVLDSLKDLQGKSIVTFQGAREFFGKDFAAYTNPQGYTEMAQPGWQVRQLAHGKAQVSVGDLFIFLHNLKANRNLKLKAQDFNYHHILPQNSSRMGFQDKTLCQQFNQAYEEVIRDKAHLAIYEKWFKRYNFQPDQWVRRRLN